MSIGTPRSTNYVLCERHTFIKGGETLILEKGAFVRPIRPGLVPSHIKNQVGGAFFNERTETYCFTKYGMIIIPSEKIQAL